MGYLGRRHCGRPYKVQLLFYFIFYVFYMVVPRQVGSRPTVSDEIKKKKVPD